MTINQKNPQSSRSSLIERAAQTYGLRDMLGKGPFKDASASQPAAAEWAARPVLPPVEMPVVTPAPMMAPPPVVASPIAQPLEHPVQVAASAPITQPVQATVIAAPVVPPVVASVAPAVVASIDEDVLQPYVAPPAHRVPVQGTADVNINQLRATGFIVPGSPPSVLSEEFRMIKRQILLQAFGAQNAPALPKGRQLLVCSAQPNDGKSFSSVNLALSMVTETDIEVLIIDADVAKPEVLSLLGLPAGPGLMDALADPSIDPETLVMRTTIPGLLVLPAGRQTNNDTELLASKRTHGVLERLIEANPRRIVIFDSAPALAASPASVLALHVGQILLVVRADVTTEGELREALAMLDGGAHIQLLLNGVTFSGSNRKFGHYYGLGDR